VRIQRYNKYRVSDVIAYSKGDVVILTRGLLVIVITKENYIELQICELYPKQEIGASEKIFGLN